MSGGHGLPTAPGGGWIGGFGNVGVGLPGPPATSFPRPDLCAAHDHPGVTYNPWTDSTWCLCGERAQAGNRVQVLVDTDTHYRALLANPEPRPSGWTRESGTYCLTSDRPRPQQLHLFEEAA